MLNLFKSTHTHTHTFRKVNTEKQKEKSNLFSVFSVFVTQMENCDVQDTGTRTISFSVHPDSGDASRPLSVRFGQNSKQHSSDSACNWWQICVNRAALGDWVGGGWFFSKQNSESQAVTGCIIAPACCVFPRSHAKSPCVHTHWTDVVS